MGLSGQELPALATAGKGPAARVESQVKSESRRSSFGLRELREPRPRKPAQTPFALPWLGRVDPPNPSRPSCPRSCTRPPGPDKYTAHILSPHTAYPPHMLSPPACPPHLPALPAASSTPAAPARTLPRMGCGRRAGRLRAGPPLRSAGAVVLAGHAWSARRALRSRGTGGAGGAGVADWAREAVHACRARKNRHSLRSGLHARMSG